MLQHVKTLILALALSIGISYAYAAWAPPSATPTGGNTDAPVNVGNATQVKGGGLAVSGLLRAMSILKVGDTSPTADCTVASDAGVIKYNGSDIFGCIDTGGGVYGWKSLTATGGGGAGCPTGSWIKSVPGTYTVTVGTDIPSCVTTLKTIKLWGGGGGGASGTSNWGSSGGGGGGGGFGQVVNYPVTSGATFTVVVGGGGVKGQRGGNWDVCTGGQNGNSSNFGPFAASGGSGGVSGGPDWSNSSTSCNGGSPGSASGPGIIPTSGIGGENGRFGDMQTGGNGGAGANGGAGGSGASYSGTAGPGTAPGGGGGGGFSGSGTDGVRGGDGAPGQVEVTW